MPRAGIEPTPRTDIGYRPVIQTRQSRREPFGHHVPPADADRQQDQCSHVSSVWIIHYTISGTSL
jgi:hypothetical protein